MIPAIAPRVHGDRPGGRRPAGGHLPLGLGGQTRPAPAAVGVGVVPAYIDHRVVVEGLDTVVGRAIKGGRRAGRGTSA